MLTKILRRCGIAEGITAYDDEVTSLIESAKIDMKQSGVLPEIIATANDQVLNCIACYVKAYRGNDRTDTATYKKLYEDMRFRLTFEEVPENVV